MSPRRSFPRVSPRPPAARGTPCRTPRHGMALPMALVLLVVLTALSGGAFAMSRQSYRGGRNAMVEQRAFSVAEAGLNRQIANWDPAFNLPAPPGAPCPNGTAPAGVRTVPVGCTVAASLFVAQGDTARVRITRLDPALYWVQALGRASIPQPALRSARNVGALVRLGYPSMNVKGAITTNGDVQIQGGAFSVNGADRTPFAGTAQAWDPTRCAGITTGDTLAGIVVPPRVRVNYPRDVVIGGVLQDPLAADSNTYVRFGTETMNTLIQNASIRYLPATPGGSVSIERNAEPALNAEGECDRTLTTNWGEPYGPNASGAVAQCRSHFPIIYVGGSTTINANGRGQGILIIDGSLTLNGSFDWVGVILIRDDMNRGTGNANVLGAIMARNIDVQGNSVYSGSQVVNYSRCGIESALRGSAILIRVRDRSWTQLF